MTDLILAYEKLTKPFANLREREGHGGNTYKYVASSDIIKRLNQVFGLHWNFVIKEVELVNDFARFTTTRHDYSEDVEVVPGPQANPEENPIQSKKIKEKTIYEESQKPRFVTALVQISVLDESGNVWVKESWGSSDIKFLRDSGLMVDYGNDKKSAVSDALKKCAQLMGVALDVANTASTNEQHEEIIRLLNAVKAPNIPPKEDLVNMTYSEANGIIETLQARLN